MGKYSAEQLAFFASYKDHRAPWAPAECSNGEKCWVKCGPPSLANVGGNASTCIECNNIVAKKMGGGYYRYA